MEDFRIHLKTELAFGEHSLSALLPLLHKYKKHNVLILFGQSFAVKSGLLDNVKALLESQNINYWEYGGISPNPEIIYVREARNLAREKNIDLLLAIGGGSVIDVAKAVSVSVYYDGDPLDFSTHLATPNKIVDVGVILTHASAGSEMSQSSVISEAESHFKQGFRSELIRPLFALSNPYLTHSVSFYQTAVGITDSFMHSLERYFCPSDDIALSDEFSMAIFKTLYKCAEALLLNPEDKTARANLMLASSFTHNDITGMGKATNLQAHALEHGLSALYPSIIHGHGLAIIYPAWLKFYYPYIEGKLARIGREVFGIAGEEPKVARETITAFENLFTRLGLSLTLRSVGVKNTDLEKIADIVTKNGTKKVYHAFHSLDKNDIINIYEMCY